MGMNQHEKPAPPARRWGEALDPHAPVSYTHLTLPTTPYV